MSASPAAHLNWGVLWLMIGGVYAVVLAAVFALCKVAGHAKEPPAIPPDATGGQPGAG